MRVRLFRGERTRFRQILTEVFRWILQNFGQPLIRQRAERPFAQRIKFPQRDALQRTKEKNEYRRESSSRSELTKLQTSERDVYFEEKFASGDVHRGAQTLRYVPLYNPHSVNLDERTNDHDGKVEEDERTLLNRNLRL